MTHADARHAAFGLLATAIPRIAHCFGSVPAAVEVLDAVYNAASTPDVAGHARHLAALDAAQRLAGLVAKKGGELTALDTSDPDDMDARAAWFGYAAVWETVAAVTAGRDLPNIAREIVQSKEADATSAVHAAATGQHLPGRQIPRTQPLAASPLVAALLRGLPEQPRGKLRIANGIAIWGEHDAGTLAQIERCANDERVVGAALAADGHRGYAIPIGGIIAYDNAVSPNGVGFDIGCGIKAVKTDMRADDLLGRGANGRTLLATVMDDLQQQIAFGMGRAIARAVDHPLFDDPIWGAIKEVGRLRDMAAR